MKIKVLDFEQVAVCYKPYVDAVTALEDKGTKLREELTSMQTEAMSLMVPEEGAPELDDTQKAENQQKFQRIQQEAMLKDKSFKMEADEEQRRIVMMSYDGISAIVKKHVESNDEVDVVFNRSEIVYYKPEADLTQTVIKESGDYTDVRLKDFKA